MFGGTRSGIVYGCSFFFFSSRRRHTRCLSDWSSDVCSSDLTTKGNKMNNGKSRPITFGMIVGNRGFFPDHLAKSGRQEMIAAIEKAGYAVVTVGAEETKFGAIESRHESAVCADLFKRRRDDIDGIIVTLPNFGEERAIADALRQANLDVPVLVQATPDSPGTSRLA